MRMRHAVLILGLLVVAGTAAAQSCLDYSTHLRWSGRGVTAGATGAVAVAGGLLFAGIDGVGLKIYSLDDPDVPSYRGVVTLPGTEWRLHAWGSLVTMVSTGASPQLFVIDAATPTAPVGLGGRSLPGGAEDMAQDGTLVAVIRAAVGADELLLLDLSDPTLPVQLSVSPVPDGATCVAAAGGLVAVSGATSALTLIDVSDPTLPVVVGAWNGTTGVRDVALAEGRAYLAGDAGLRVIDVSTPASPTFLGALPGPSGWGRLAVRDGVVWLGGADATGAPGQLCRVDASTPTAPVATGSLGVGARCLAATADRVYLARGSLGLDVVAGETGVAPIGRWLLPDPDLPPTALALVADLALVAVDATTPSGNPYGLLHVVDVSAPAAPYTAGTLSLTGVPTDVAESGGIAVVPWYHVRTNRGGVSFVDVSEPSAPSLLATFTVYGAPTRVLWTPPWAAVGVRSTSAGTGDHLLVLNAADPAAPTLAEQEPLPYAPGGLARIGDRLYLTGGDEALAWLDAYDYADPAEPLLVESFGLNRVFNDLKVRGDLLYALEEGGTVDLLDLSYGTFIWYRAESWLPASGRNLVLAARRLYVAAGDLVLVDVLDVDAPAPAGSFGDGTAVDVETNGDFVLLLDAGGLWCLPTDCAGVTPVFARSFTARRRDGVALLSWELSAGNDGDALEVDGRSGDRVWSVPVAGAGRAVDPTPPSGETTYSLFLAADGVRTELARDVMPPAATTARARFLGAGPNPFNPRTTLRYALPVPGHVRVAVHTLDGALVRLLFAGEQAAGEHALPWDGRDADGRALPSGAYLCRLEAGEQVSSLRVTLVR